MKATCKKCKVISDNIENHVCNLVLPIYKFNRGLGCTLCNKCFVIITNGLTDDLLCKKCKKEL